MKRRYAELLLLTLALCAICFFAGFSLGGKAKSPAAGIYPRYIPEQTAIAVPASQTRSVPETAPSAAPSEQQESTETAQQESTDAAPTGPVNINTAGVSELCTLPGIGEVLAQRIVAYRESSGGFSSVDELDKVEGIGSKRLDAIREFVTVEEEE